MRGWVKIGVGVAGGVAVASTVAAVVGLSRWRGDTARRVARLQDQSNAEARAVRERPAVYAEEMLTGLPAPVARYFRFALTPGQRLIRSATLDQVGTFATKPDAWVPFVATEHVYVRPVGFLWDASMRMIPAVPTLVRDYYLTGEGGVRASIAGVVTVANAHGTPALAEGALMRWLAEAVWIPTALLPGGGVTWEPIDDSTARATIVDGDVRASLDFRFADDGRITGTTGVRWRDDGRTSERLPWLGRHDGYERVDGMMIPRTGEVGWMTPAGYQGYWRGRQERLRYEYETTGDRG